jgi:hypothetical protein
MPRGHKLPESHLAAEKKIRKQEHENQLKDKSSLWRTSPERTVMIKGKSSSLGTSLEEEELEGINIMENFSLERINLEAAGIINFYFKCLPERSRMFLL